MDRIYPFILNHWALVSLWAVLAATLVVYLGRKSGKALSPQQATLLVNREDGVILDIRERKDFERGHIVDAINIPLAKLQERLTELEKKKERPLVVVCQMGQHAGEAVKLLEAAGFARVSRMSGGMAEWAGQNLPLVK
jgi:rhodanese-related sulfurtransferase